MPVLLRAKCLIVGDATVGKSALSQVFQSDGSHFPKNYAMTTGVELYVKAVNIPDTSGDSVELYIYDSAGKETYSDFVQKHWENPSVVMAVYDVTNEISFSSCATWLERVRQFSPDGSLTGVLVANKTDLTQRRMVSPKEGKELAMDRGLEYFECSAKEMQNVEAPFYFMAQSFYAMYKEKTQFFKSLQ